MTDNYIPSLNSVVSNRFKTIGPKFKIQELLLASIECPICCEIVVNPRSLPCLHDFCISCLEAYCKDKEPKNEIPCPVCRKYFSVPQHGLLKLPLNCFVTSVLELVQCSRRSLSRQKSFDEGDDVSTVQNGRGNPSFLLKANSWPCKPSLGTSSSRLRTYSSRTDDNNCVIHKDESITLLCCECNRTTCLVCHATDHRFHASQPIKGAAAEIRKQLRDKEMKLTSSLKVNRDQISLAKLKALKSIVQVRGDISDSVARLRAQLDQYENELNLRLEQLEREAEAHYDQVEQDMKEFEEVVSDVKKSCQYLRTGGDLEVIEKYRELRDEVNELLQLEQQTLESRTSSSEVAWFSRGLGDPDFTNLIGEIQSNAEGLSQGILKSAKSRPLRYRQQAAERKDSTLDVASCRRPVLVSSRTSVSVIEVKGQVRGATVLNDQLYVVVRNKPRVYIYTTSSADYIGAIHVEDLKNSSSLVSCPYHNYLYISDPETETVFQIDVESRTLRSRWHVADMSYNILSVSSLTHLLLVPLFYSNCIIKYSPVGSSVQRLTLPSDVDHPKQCVHMCTDLYLICHQGVRLHRVCLCSERGEVLAVYGSEPGLSVTRLNGPWCAVVDSRGFIYVADFNNDIVLVFDSQLHRVGPLGVLTQYQLKKPGAMHFDITCARLVIGEYDSNRILIASATKNKTN